MRFAKPRNVENFCPTCGLIHPPLVPCTEVQSRTVKEILIRCGIPDKCPGPCGQSILWLKTTDGKPHPVDETGLPHKFTCQGKHRDTRVAPPDVKDAAKALLLKCGDVRQCPRPCGQTIHWLRDKDGKSYPVNETGLPHKFTCDGRYRKD